MVVPFVPGFNIVPTLKLHLKDNDKGFKTHTKAKNDGQENKKREISWLGLKYTSYYPPGSRGENIEASQKLRLNDASYARVRSPTSDLELYAKPRSEKRGASTRGSSSSGSSSRAFGRGLAIMDREWDCSRGGSSVHSGSGGRVSVGSYAPSRSRSSGSVHSSARSSNRDHTASQVIRIVRM